MKKRGNKLISIWLFVLVPVLSVSLVYATVPERINYQGYLTDSGGTPVNTPKNMTFIIYNQSGTALWTETHNNVPVNDGIYNVILGSVVSLGSLPFDVPYYLGITIGTDTEMTPRQPLASVAYAFTADTALNAANSVTSLDGAGPAGAGTSNLYSRGDHKHGFALGAITSQQIKDNDVTSTDILDGTITSADVGFNYAGSTSKGGAASDLNCSGCVSQSELSFAPLLSETDPQVGTLTNSKWCTSNGTQVICTSDTPTSSSGWTDDGTVVRLTTNTDKVGIGTTTLSEELHVKDTVGQIYLQGIFQGTSSSGGIGLLASNGQQYELQSLNNGGFALFDRTDGKYSLYVDTTQNVGIGDMTSPQQKLDVNGQIRAKSGYGDYIRLGGDNAGGDVEISIAAPAERNHVSFWNEQLQQAANLGAKNIYINGASITTSGWTSPHLNLVLSSNTAYNSSILQAADGLLFRNYSQPADEYVNLFSFRNNADQKLMYLSSGYAYFNVVGIFWNGLASYGDTYLYGGNVYIEGNLSKPLGSFKIDHPLDPENKYLYHSFVESPDMMNIYNGNVILDNNGEAWVDLPVWFEALNQDFRYQLTCIGGFAPVYIESEISGNRFKIAGGQNGMKVSWQVTGVRHDPIANLKRIKVEEIKPDKEKGPYLYPEAYGQPKGKGIRHQKHQQ